ncbi:GNAT family N-acetyltransferase [Phaeobacter italicus]|uniref:GNAT family N-acetyltransferase n=1 Tax=Phaeobacter italicus TaxID=481446 RepID=UPI001ADA062D|nr:GNAT family N-acyltransferase [Phaeobacter italicus]MBO9440882.1 GNAT family N-acetyltransferase [Phaeobacter italicus]
MSTQSPQFQVTLARTDDDLRAAQALRYSVFVRELGGSGEMVDHQAGLERDRFDPYCDHLLLRDLKRAEVVGVYRVLRSDQAAQAGQFYSADEYDLSALVQSGRKLLELGRSCLHPEYRGGMAMFHLWSALAEYVAAHDIEVLFGVASFHGTDVGPLCDALSMLHHNHLAPEELRPVAKTYQAMDLMPKEAVDRRKAMLDTPALIKAYLRLGGVVGDGAYVDHAFNTTDVCLVLDTAKMNERQRRIYEGGRNSA